MKHTLKSVRTLAATLITFGSLAGGANAAITVVSVNATTVNIANTLGNDFFGLRIANSGTAFFFGNSDGNNLNTANRVPLNAFGDLQYFQVDTAIPLILGTPLGSSRAYFFNSDPNSGGTAGINFSIYDANQDGIPDTVFYLDFGPSITDFSDDIIVAYAFDSSLSGIDVSAARDALLVPEPSTALLLGLGSMSLLTKRHRRVVEQEAAS